jgi:hypothetical protein
MQRVTLSPVFSAKRSRHILFCGGGAGTNCFDVLRFLITASTLRFPPNQAQPICRRPALFALANCYSRFSQIKTSGRFRPENNAAMPAAPIFNVARESAL